MNTPNRAVDGLRRHARQRSADARKKIEKALRELRKTDSSINVNAVARRAGVTRKTIHNHPDLLERIRAHTQIGTPTITDPPDTGQPNSIITALRNTLTAKDHQISELKTALRQRDNAIAALHGELERLAAREGRQP